jgi:hypothetical protein
MSRPGRKGSEVQANRGEFFPLPPGAFPPPKKNRQPPYLGVAWPCLGGLWKTACPLQGAPQQELNLSVQAAELVVGPFLEGAV